MDYLPHTVYRCIYNLHWLIMRRLLIHWRGHFCPACRNTKLDLDLRENWTVSLQMKQPKRGMEGGEQVEPSVSHHFVCRNEAWYRTFHGANCHSYFVWHSLCCGHGREGDYSTSLCLLCFLVPNNSSIQYFSPELLEMLLKVSAVDIIWKQRGWVHKHLVEFFRTPIHCQSHQV